MTLNAPPCCRTLTCVMPVLCMFNLQTKFEMSSFIHSKDMAWVPKCPTWGQLVRGQLVITRLILHVVNSCAKFEVSCCCRCRDISGGVKFYNVTWPWPRPFQGWLVISRLGLATINIQIKFEVSNYTHYEDMKSGANIEIEVVWGG